MIELNFSLVNFASVFMLSIASFAGVFVASSLSVSLIKMAVEWVGDMLE